MSTVWRWLARLLLVLLFAFAALVAIWGYGRLSSPTAEQQAAIAVMQADGPMQGENGFDLLLALPPAPTVAFPEAWRCRDEAQAACIDAVEAAPEANAAALEAWRPRLEAAARALHAPVFRDARERVASSEASPPYQEVVRLASLRAFQFSTGDTRGALANACKDASAALRWATNPDVLIDGMIGIAVFRRNAGLIADMRRRAPNDPLPASCAVLADPPDPAVEGVLCGAMRGEWRWQKRSVWPELEAEVARKGGAALAWIRHDAEWQQAAMAQAFAPACGDAARDAARADRLPAPTPSPVRWVDRVAYPAGAILVDLALPAYDAYLERQLDFVAWRRLLAATLRMQAMEATLTDAQRFNALPAELRGDVRPLRLDEATRTLRVPLRGSDAGRTGGEASLPVLPVATES